MGKISRATWILLAMVASTAWASENPPVGSDRIQAVIDDVERACRQGPVYMIGPNKAHRLAELVRQRRPKLVVEGGTALGYSGLWIARELKNLGGGKLLTMEISPRRAKQAEENFRRAGLAEYVEVRVGDARQLSKDIKGPIDFVFVDCGYANYFRIFQNIERELAPAAMIVADNVGIGSGGMKDYLDAVRTKYDSRTEWFDMDLPWAQRDAMEVTILRRRRGPFLDWPEDKGRKIGDRHAQSAAAGFEELTPVKPSTYAQYLDRKLAGRITVESLREGYVYYVICAEYELAVPPSTDGPVSALLLVNERYKAKLPAKD